MSCHTVFFSGKIGTLEYFMEDPVRLSELPPEMASRVYSIILEMAIHRAKETMHIRQHTMTIWQNQNENFLRLFDFFSP